MKPFVEDIKLHVDDRGSVYCAVDNIGVRIDLGEVRRQVKRTYVVHNWQAGRIRAWHGHMKGWTGLHVIHGASKIVARMTSPDGEDFAPGEHLIATLSDKKPQIFWVPPGWYNGHMSLVDDTKILVYSTQTFEEVKQDDIRMVLTQNDYVDFFKVADR